MIDVAAQPCEIAVALSDACHKCGRRSDLGPAFGPKPQVIAALLHVPRRGGDATVAHQCLRDGFDCRAVLLDGLPAERVGHLPVGEFAGETEPLSNAFRTRGIRGGDA